MHRRGLSILLIVACSFAGCTSKAPEKVNDAMTLIVSYSERGRYDDAIRVAQDWMEKHPQDSLYDQVAICYLAKASNDSGHKDQWVQQAAVNFERVLAAHEKDGVGVELYEVGRGFERAGDLSTNDRCVYYSRAVKAFEEEAQFIQGDSYTAYGHTTPLAPVRQENQKALERVKSKIDNARCTKAS